MRKLLTQSALVLLILGLSGNALLMAQSRSEQTGEISIEEDKAVSPYKMTQDKTIDYAKQLDQLVAKLASGSTASGFNIDEASLSHLTAAYLYCSVENGSCPEVPDALLELDLINSKLAGKISCENSNKFWSLWLKNDMESRHKYQVKTGYLKKTEEFNRVLRPKYIKCKQTLTEELKDAGADYFRKRYTLEKRTVGSALAAILESIKRKVPNIFVAVGAAKS